MTVKVFGRFAATHRRAFTLVTGAVVAASLAACQDAESATSPVIAQSSQLTPGSGSASTLLSRANFAEGFKVKRRTGFWKFEITTSIATDVAVQSITFQPGGHSGWHRHPGAVFIQVASGTMTFYDSEDPTCTPMVRTAGQGFLDTGEHAHLARNETGTPATNIVTYFAPQGAPLRIDAPAPGNCPF